MNGVKPKQPDTHQASNLSTTVEKDEGSILGRAVTTIKNDPWIWGIGTSLGITAIALFCIAGLLVALALKRNSNVLGIGAAGLILLGTLPMCAAMSVFAYRYAPSVQHTYIPPSAGELNDYIQIGSAYIHSPRPYNPHDPFNLQRRR